jgi:hypothetical protein
MDAHKWMFTFNILRTSFRVVAVEVRMSGAVNGCPAVDDLAERRGELLVSGVSAGPKGITPNGWNRIIMKVGHAGWLPLMDEICVPSRGAPRTTKTGWYFSCLQSGPHDRHAGNAGDLSGLRLL